MPSIKLLFSLLVVVIAINLTRALRIGNSFSNYDARTHISYKIIDNSTSPWFEKEIGWRFGLYVLSGANPFVLKTLDLEPGERKDYAGVLLVVESFKQAGIGGYPDAVASTVDNNIRLNSDYLEGFKGDAQWEFPGIVIQESTRVWQWTAQGLAPTGLIDGIAAYVRLIASWPSADWGKRGSGDRWDEGQEVTAYFLEYCEGIMEGFVSKLNAMMKDFYTNDFFIVLLGKSVDELWSEYKLAYACPAPAPST